MPDSYLLTCECGAQHVVQNRQAGKSIDCGCGIKLEVPTLRRLRELPPAENSTDAGADRSAWGARQKMSTLGLLLALALGGGGIYLWRTEPKPPPRFDSEEYLQSMEAGVEEITPLQSWVYWTENRILMHHGTLEVLLPPSEGSAAATRRRVRYGLLGAAAALAAGSVGLFAIGGKGR